MAVEPDTANSSTNLGASASVTISIVSQPLTYVCLVVHWVPDTVALTNVVRGVNTMTLKGDGGTNAPVALQVWADEGTPTGSQTYTANFAGTVRIVFGAFSCFNVKSYRDGAGNGGIAVSNSRNGLPIPGSIVFNAVSVDGGSSQGTMTLSGTDHTQIYQRDRGSYASGPGIKGAAGIQQRLEFPKHAHGWTWAFSDQFIHYSWVLEPPESREQQQQGAMY